MDVLDDQLTEERSNISPTAIEQMRKSARWMKILAILVFSFLGLMFLSILFVFGSNGGVGSPLWTVIFLLLYFLPTLYLYQAGTHFKKYADENNPNDLETAFSKQHAFFQFIGVVSFVLLGIVILMVVIGGATYFTILERL